MSFLSKDMYKAERIFGQVLKKRTAIIKTSRIVRRSITCKIFHKYAALCEGNTTIGAFSIMIFPWSNQFCQQT